MLELLSQLKKGKMSTWAWFRDRAVLWLLTTVVPVRVEPQYQQLLWIIENWIIGCSLDFAVTLKVQLSVIEGQHHKKCYTRGRKEGIIRKYQPQLYSYLTPTGQWLRWRILAFSIGLSTQGTTGWWLLSKVYVDIWTDWHGPVFSSTTSLECCLSIIYLPALHWL